jgi:hypothetical protein
MSTFVDPRIRMRDALNALVHDQGTTWDQPSLAVFRNRLLDLTGSDARPLADLLVEAIQRGWRDALPCERLATARWDALSAPFVMRWSAERFIQLDMALWAAESWALAFDVIAPEQLRTAIPSARTSNGSPAAVMAHGPARLPRTFARGGRIPVATNTPLALGGSRGTRTPAPYRPARPAALPMLDPRIVWGLAAAAALTYAGFIGRIAWSVLQAKRAERALAASAPTAASVTSPPRAVIDSTDTLRDTLRDTLSAGRDSLSVASPVTDSTARIAAAPNRRGPGVPSVTRSLLDSRVADPARMLYVEPTRRAAGSSLPVDLPALPPSLTYDEVMLNDGTTMRGRVDIVRAGTVIFRDMRTGLRHELRKEDIDRIITEYGAPVRFRAADATPGAKSAAAAAKRVETGVRARGVSGAYVIRYAAATAVGSPECTQVWTRPPNAIDQATVRHVAGADALTVAFDGGDTFPSNIDPEGYFASTFRIVPDQARTSTALTTRLTGQFTADGKLALQVSIVFFRRMREGRDITCTVTVKADGQRGRS